MAEIVFASRPHAAAFERTYRLDDENLVVFEDGKPAQRIPLADVTKVTLSYVGTGQGYTYCNAVTRSNQTVHIRSHNFVGVGEFEDRHATFDPFIAALCGRVAKHNPSASFVSGRWLYFWIWLFVFIVAAGFAITFLNDVLSSGEFEAESVMGIVVGTGVALTTLGAAIANRVEPFDPLKPPLHEYGQR